MPEKGTRPTPPPLTFQWQEPLRAGRRLSFWIFVVLCGLVAFFYLFQVVYPQTQRFTPVPQSVLILSPSDPAAMAVLGHVQDRNYLFLPGDSSASSTPGLMEQGPKFHPTFEKHEMQIQDLPYRPFTVPPARLLSPDKPLLPPPDLSQLKSPTAQPGASPQTKPKLVMSIAGNLAGRAVKYSPDLSDLLVAHPEACRFQVGVGSDGTVTFLLPISISDRLKASPELMDHMLKRLKEVRFEALAPPAATVGTSPPGPAWGTITLSWSEAPAL